MFSIGLLEDENSVELLIKKGGANVNAVDNKLRTPLIEAATRRKSFKFSHTFRSNNLLKNAVPTTINISELLFARWKLSLK